MHSDRSSHGAEATQSIDGAAKETADEIPRDGDDNAEFEWPIPEGALSIEVLDLSHAADERVAPGQPSAREGAEQPASRRSGLEVMSTASGRAAFANTAMFAQSLAAPIDGLSTAPSQLDRSRFAAPSSTAQVMRRLGERMRPRSPVIAITLLVLATLVVAEGVALTRLIRQPPNVVSAAAEPVHAAPVAASRASQPESQVATIGSKAAQTPRPVAPLSTTVASGRLVIDSDPSGAQVSIDGRPYGTTPLTLPDVTPGERQIVLRRGSVQVRQAVMVDAGRTVSIVAPMQQSASPAVGGWLSISSPVDVDVIERGSLVGTSRSPQIMLAEGTHAISLVNDGIGYKDNQQVRITAGTVTHLAVKLPQTTMAINAAPWAEVSIDGKVVGVTPLGNVPVTIGPHEVVFRHPELGDKKLTTVVKAGAPARLSADLRRQ